MFNRKLNERIDLLFQRIDSLTEKIVEVDSKLVRLQGDVTNISFRVSNLDITTKSLSDEMDEFGKLNMVVMSETNGILNDIEYLTKKLHDAKVINASEYYENGDDYCPIEEAESKKQDSEKDNVVLGSKSEAIGIEGGEFVIGKPKSEAKEIYGE
jgi:chromosome segregation ATPase